MLMSMKPSHPSVCQVIVALVMFAIYVLLDNDLNVATVFTVLALMNAIRFPIALLPMALSSVRTVLSRPSVFFFLT